ncbi:unnamed protein product [Camellia sinensis]
MGSSGLPFPVTHQKLSLDIKIESVDNGRLLSQSDGVGLDVDGPRGNKTDLVICSYDDHFLVIATQIGSMGTILHARKEEGMLIQPTFNVSVICGKRDEPMLVACARQLIENIRPLETLKGIVHAVVENRL